MYACQPSPSEFHFLFALGLVRSACAHLLTSRRDIGSSKLPAPSSPPPIIDPPNRMNGCVCMCVCMLEYGGHMSQGAGFDFRQAWT